MFQRINWVGVVVIVTLIASGGASIWQGTYSIDPHHWGLMLSNAKDLYDGRLPYKDIFIQYGFGTTLIHAFAFSINQSLQSILIITVVFYCSGLWLIYKISLLVSGNRVWSMCVFLTCVGLHPIVVYPWSNYLAFPLIAFGLYNLLISPSSNIRSVLTGLSFGIAVLIREGLAPALLLICIFNFLSYAYLEKKYKFRLNNFIFNSIGFFTPIILFICFLYLNNLLSYWLIYAWDLPRVYIKWWPHMSGPHLFDKLMATIWINSKELIVNWIVLGLSLICSVSVILRFLIQPRAVNFSVLQISIAACLLTSSALHSPEVFRLATGSSIAIIVFYHLLSKINLQMIIFSVVGTLLACNISSEASGNNFFPGNDIRLSAVQVDTPSIFQNQKWSAEIRNYYYRIATDLKDLNQRECKINYHQNQTKDTFLSVLSPFKNYSLSPFLPEEDWLPLRPDIIPVEEKTSDMDMILFRMFSVDEVANIHPPSGYFIFKKYRTPEMIFIPSHSSLLIFVPTTCHTPADQ